MPVVSREQLEASLAALCEEVTDPAAGILGPRSLVWRLGGDLGVFLGGGRASLLQLAHPFVATAIDRHSRTRTDVAGRFQRTFRNVFAMLFGDLDDALAAARRVHTIHSRIHGELPAAIAGYPRGARYHANDVDALRWVHATLLDTTVVVRERLDGALPTSTKDRYVVELHRFAQLFGIPRTDLPATWDEHARYMTSMLASDRLGVTDAARAMGQFLFGRSASPETAGARPPPPDDRSSAGDRSPSFVRQPPLGRVAEAVTASLLPPQLARAFGLRASPALVEHGLRAFAAIYARLPRELVKTPARSAAVRRLQGRGPSRLASWTERQLFGLAHRVSG